MVRGSDESVELKLDKDEKESGIVKKETNTRLR